MGCSPRPERRPKWQEADMAHLEQSLQQEAQTHNAQQLVHQLQQEQQLTLNPRRLRRILKKRATLEANLTESLRLTELTRETTETS